MWNEGEKTFQAGEDLEAKRRVKIEAGTANDPPEVVYADAGEAYIGVTEYAVKDGEKVTVKLKNASGTFEIECAIGTAIERGTSLYGAADGKVSDTASGSIQFTSLEIATANNEHIEVLPV
jgi:hypothetical protein